MSVGFSCSSKKRSVYNLQIVKASTMVEPLSVAVNLVNGLTESLKDVRTNREHCALLVDRAKQAMVLLNMIRSKLLAEQSVVEAIRHMNEGLKRAQDVVGKCCTTNCFCTLLLNKKHSLELQQAEKGLNNALFQINLAVLGMTCDIQDHVDVSVDSENQEKFDEGVTVAQEANMTTTEIKEAFVQTYQEIAEAFAQATPTTGEASSQTSEVITKASAQMNRQIENVENEITQMQKLGLQLENAGVLMVTRILTKDISEISAKVKTNKDGCTLLARLAQQTLTFLEQFDENALSNSLLMLALCHVNEALAIMKHSIVKCYNTTVFQDASLHERYSSTLKEAATMLENALAEMSPSLHGMTLTIQSKWASLCNEIHNSKFDGSANVAKDNTHSEQPKDFVEALQPAKDYDRQSPLHRAMSSNSVDAIKKLITNGFDVNVQDNYGRTPLHIASENNSIDVFKKLIANGAEVNVQNKNGESPLYVASQKNSIAVVKELIACGVDINLQSNIGWSPLYIASFHNHVEVVKELIASDADINLQSNVGECPLNVASQKDAIDVVKELIASGANIDAQNSFGWSSLYIASFLNRVDIVKELITNGADINLQTNNGWSPLSIASKENRIDIVKELLASGASVDIQTNNGDTPLHVASSCGRIDVVQILLKHGASKKDKNYGSEQPYDVVCTNQSHGPYEESTINDLKSLLRR